MSRRQHYGQFYDGVPGNGPLALVHGNCQAEALRVVLATSPALPFTLVRVPPVHELEQADLPPLTALLRRCRLLVSQPVRPGYRGLPLGTGEVAALLPAGGRVVRVPVVRWVGLHPWQAIVRLSDGAEPPLVPYHDLRTLVGREPREPDLVAAAEQSLASLAPRERRDADVAVSDLLLGLGADAVHVLNHPGNALLLTLAHRVQAAIGLAPDAVDPGRVLLGRIRAPVEPAALTAIGAAGPPREHWLVDGEIVPDARVRAAHRAFYDARPDAVAAGRERWAERLGLLGLA